MHDQFEPVARGGRAQQGDPGQRPGAQGERGAAQERDALIDDPGAHRLGETDGVQEGELGQRLALDHLARLLTPWGGGLEPGSQRLVPFGHPVPRGARHHGIEFAGHLEGDRDEMVQPLRIDLVQQPDASLRGGEREPVGAGGIGGSGGRGGGRGGGRFGHQFRQVAGQAPRRRMVEYRGRGDPLTQRMAQPSRDPHREQRIPAEGEEVGLGVDPMEVQHVPQGRAGGVQQGDSGVRGVHDRR